jgi:hypothetical protein
MALLEILTPNEQKLFDSPPQFLSTEDRKNYFKLDEGLSHIVNDLRGKTNKIGFILQLGYFRWAARFFSKRSFHKKDLNFLVKHFSFLANDVNMDNYSSTSYSRHQELILEYLGYAKFDQNVFTQEIERLSHKYIRPKQILIAIKEGFKRLKIELPSYYMFAATITAEYNKTEKIILEKIEKQLTKNQLKEINDLLPTGDQNNLEKQAYKRSVLTGLRHVKQSLKPKDIKYNIQNFIKIKSLYNEFKPIIDELNLSKEANNYYAIWVLKAKTAQVAQFANIYKRALYVISFIAFQHSYSQDILVDILLRSTQTTLNSIKQLQKDNDFEKRDVGVISFLPNFEYT